MHRKLIANLILRGIGHGSSNRAIVPDNTFLYGSSRIAGAITPACKLGRIVLYNI